MHMAQRVYDSKQKKSGPIVSCANSTIRTKEIRSDYIIVVVAIVVAVVAATDAVVVIVTRITKYDM
jgi:hypothetical protein